MDFAFYVFLRVSRTQVWRFFIKGSSFPFPEGKLRFSNLTQLPENRIFDSQYSPPQFIALFHIMSPR